MPLPITSIDDLPRNTKCYLLVAVHRSNITINIHYEVLIRCYEHRTWLVPAINAWEVDWDGLLLLRRQISFFESALVEIKELIIDDVIEIGLFRCDGFWSRDWLQHRYDINNLNSNTNKINKEIWLITIGTLNTKQKNS